MHNPMLFRMYTLFYSLLCSITSMTLVHPFVLCSVNVVFRIYRLTFDVAVVHFRLNPTEMPLTMGFGYFRNFQFKRFFSRVSIAFANFFPLTCLLPKIVIRYLFVWYGGGRVHMLNKQRARMDTAIKKSSSPSIAKFHRTTAAREKRMCPANEYTQITHPDQPTHTQISQPTSVLVVSNFAKL